MERTDTTKLRWKNPIYRYLQRQQRAVLQDNQEEIDHQRRQLLNLSTIGMLERENRRYHTREILLIGTILILFMVILNILKPDK